MSKKICFVVQRYGVEVNGGAELLCRQLAEHLLEKYQDVHVLTSKALEYTTWEDFYKEENEIVNGVKVHRFSVSHPRVQSEFNKINDRFMNGELPREEELEWLDRQGPAVPALIEYIREHKDDYDVFIFCTYLYYPIVMGISEVAEKSIMIPNAHDEPFLRMKIYDNVFLKPRAFFFNTEEERQLIHKKYHNENIPSLLGGAGVDVPDSVDGARFRKKYGLRDYIIYVGRLDEGKNCSEMFRFFREYKKTHENDLKLVTLGKAAMPLPQDENIINLGFVSDEDKFDGIAGAKMLWLPSVFESLSIVVLEAMSLHTPVIVNGKCPVLKGHCLKSNGAFYYDRYEEFVKEVEFYMFNNTLTEAICRNAYQYVKENYQWDIIIEKLSSLIEKI